MDNTEHKDEIYFECDRCKRGLYINSKSSLLNIIMKCTCDGYYRPVMYEDNNNEKDKIKKIKK